MTEYSLIVPIDGGLREGPIYGRGMPGVSSWIVGYLNSPAIQRDVLHVWQNTNQPLSYQLSQSSMPHVNLFLLSMEWACPVATHEWHEGNQVGERFARLTGNPCKSYYEQEPEISRDQTALWLNGQEWC